MTRKISLENVTNVVRKCIDIVNAKRMQRSWRWLRRLRRQWMKIEMTWSSITSQKRANQDERKQKT